MRTQDLIPFVFALSLVACGDKGGDSGGDAQEDCSTDGLDGSILYSENSCAGCHGADGSGASGPSLETAVPTLSDDDILSTIQNGSGTMPAFDNLSCSEQTAILEYLRSTHGNEGGS